MGRKPITNERCRALQAFLLEQGITEVPRKAWDHMIVRALDVTVAQVRWITTTGESLGLWQRHIPVHGKPTSVRIVA